MESLIFWAGIVLLVVIPGCFGAWDLIEEARYNREYPPKEGPGQWWR